MKKKVTILMLSAFMATMVGCGRKIPEDIIQPADLENLLYDYQRTSSMVNSLPYTENYKKEAYYRYVFEKHHVTEAEFDSSMVWYSRNSDVLAGIYENLQKRLDNEVSQMKIKMAQRDNQVDVSMSGDTVDVWQDRNMLWLTASELTNKVQFDFKADTTFRASDAMELAADLRFIPFDKEIGSSPKVVMGINYCFENDSVQGMTQTFRSSGPCRLYFKPDSAFAIRSINGFIYYTSGKKLSGSVLLNDIRLMRYHKIEPRFESLDTLQIR